MKEQRYRWQRHQHAKVSYDAKIDSFLINDNTNCDV